MNNFKQRLGAIIKSDLVALRWTLGWLSLLYGMVFMVANTNTPAFSYMLSVLPIWAWAGLFITVGVFKLMSCFVLFTKRAHSVLISVSIWLWSFLFLSAITKVFEYGPAVLGPGTFVLCVILASEFWLAYENIETHEDKNIR